MIAGLTKAAKVAQFTSLVRGGVMDNAQKGIHQSTVLVILVVILLVALYFYGRSKDKKVKTNNGHLGEDATISGSQAEYYANALEG